MKRTLLLLLALPLGCSTCPQANIADKLFKSKNACAPCGNTPVAVAVPPTAVVAVPGPPAVAIPAPQAAPYVAPAPGCNTCAANQAGGAGPILQSPALMASSGQAAPPGSQVLTNHAPSGGENKSSTSESEELPTPKTVAPAKGWESSRSDLQNTSGDGPSLSKPNKSNKPSDRQR